VLAVISILIYARLCLHLAGTAILKHILSMLRSALFEIIPFLVLFILVFLGFSFAFYFVYGTRVYEYRSLSSTMNTNVKLIFGAQGLYERLAQVLCACVRVYMDVWLYVHVCMYRYSCPADLFRLPHGKYECLRTFIYTYTHIHKHIHILILILAHEHIHVHIRIRIHTHTHVHTHICMYEYMYMNIYIHTYIYIYIHIHRSVRWVRHTHKYTQYAYSRKYICTYIQHFPSMCTHAHSKYTS